MWSRVKNALRTHCFPKKPIVFQHVHFFIPLFWNEKLSLIGSKKVRIFFVLDDKVQVHFTIVFQR